MLLWRYLNLTQERNMKSITAEEFWERFKLVHSVHLLVITRYPNQGLIHVIWPNGHETVVRIESFDVSDDCKWVQIGDRKLNLQVNDEVVGRAEIAGDIDDEKGEFGFGGDWWKAKQ